MAEKFRIASAFNTFAPALAVLHEHGYTVSPVEGLPGVLRAENGRFILSAEDPLQLLGLAALAQARGELSFSPTDKEIEDLLALDGAEQPG